MVEFFVTLLIMLVAAIVVGEIFKRVKQPALVGQILIGIIIGPSFLNLVHTTDSLQVIIEFIVFFMMFIAGLERHPNEIKKAGKKAIFISVVSFTIPLVGVTITANSFGLGLIPSLFIGLTLAITAVPVVRVVLMEFGILESKAGITVIAAGVIDYILSMIALGIILQIASINIHQLDYGTIGLPLIKIAGFLFGILLIVILLNKTRGWLPQKFSSMFLKIKTKEAGFGILLISAFGLALIAQGIGLHFIIGAFFAGLIIYHEVIGKENFERIFGVFSAITFGFLAPIFFAFIGIEFNIKSFTGDLPLFVILLAVAIMGKIGGGFVASKISGFSNSESRIIGYLMNSRGIIELVIVFIGLKAGIIDMTIFSVIVAITLITTVMTPVMVRASFRSTLEY